jgi:hypothetical protein
MKKGSKILTAAALLSIAILASSCNRGTGCPNNFRLSETFEGLLSLVASFIG